MQARMDPATLIGLAVVVFVATDIDDLFLLIALFASARLRPWQIIAGQYLGIAALIAASLVLALVALIVPPAWIGLMGLLPIALGLKALFALSDDGDDDDEISKLASVTSIGRILAVAGVTVANGGDNLGVYVPLFATQSAPQVAVTCVVFLIVTGLWCFAARWLVDHPTAGPPIRLAGQRLLPAVLIALGAFILWDAGTITLLFP
jgi:cadmium resistance transport/sequestration family protein